MTFFNPVQISFGSGVRNHLVEEYLNKDILIFCTTSAFERYVNDTSLKKLLLSPRSILEHSFNSNPSITDIEKIGQIYQKEKIDLIFGLGGGSAMDIAKISCASIPAYQKGITIRQLLSDSEAFNKFSVLDCIQVPTTAGTGSEVTPFATIWDYDAQKKLSLSNQSMFAYKAFIDPDFLIDIPIDIALSTGLDALNQAFESIWNINSTPLSEIYSIAAVKLSLSSLLNLKKIRTCSNTRKALALSSLYAGIAISQTRTSICHSISYPITLKFGMPHGLACAFSMKEVYKFNREKINATLLSLKKNLGEDPYELISRIFDNFSVEDKISSYITDSNNLMDMLEQMKTTGRFENNIRKCRSSDLDAIVKASLSKIQ